MSPTSETAINIRQLRVVRGGRPVLEGVDLTIERGSVTGLLGPSGCGKSTLLRAIVGVQRIAGGEVRVLGLEAGSSMLRHKVAYVTQTASVYLDLTVSQNLDYFARVVGAPEAAIARVLSEVGLTGHADARAGRLSGGQLNRVSLATALLTKPQLLVLDEPTVGLDPVLRRDLWDMFSGLADRGTTILVSSHVMDEAERCQKLLLMREGAILCNEAPGQLKARTGLPDIESAFLSLVDGDEVAA
jgi:ABC-2 type transport system ATP-binding protein